MNFTHRPVSKTPQAPVRAGGEFFLTPATATQRRYEALRAYLAEGLPAAEAAARFGYTTASLLSAVRDFRAGATEFFLSGKPGPKTAPAKDAARERILELRAAGHSIDEIAAALAAEGIKLNRTGIAEVIAAEGLPRIWRRPEPARGPVRRHVQPRAEVRDFADPAQAETRLAGLLLTIPDLLALDLPNLVAAAGYPASPKSPPCPMCCPCWRSSSPRPGGSLTSMTWPPTPAPRPSPGWSRCPRRPRLPPTPTGSSTANSRSSWPHWTRRAWPPGWPAATR